MDNIQNQNECNCEHNWNEWSPKFKLYQHVALNLTKICPIHFLRFRLIKIAGINLGKNVSIGSNVTFAINPKNIFLSDGVEINNGVYFHARETITIGKNSAISPFVKFITSSNPNALSNKLGELYPPKKETICVGDNVWIGTGAIILPGINIGEMSVIGAGAVVTKDVPKCTVVGGVPAKELKKIL